MAYKLAKWHSQIMPKPLARNYDLHTLISKNSDQAHKGAEGYILHSKPVAISWKEFSTLWKSHSISPED